MVSDSFDFRTLYGIILKGTEERNQKRNAEIHHKAVEEGNDDKVLSGRAGDDGQGSVHGSGSTR